MYFSPDMGCAAAPAAGQQHGVTGAEPSRPADAGTVHGELSACSLSVQLVAAGLPTISVVVATKCCIHLLQTVPAAADFRIASCSVFM